MAGNDAIPAHLRAVPLAPARMGVY